MGNISTILSASILSRALLSLRHAPPQISTGPNATTASEPELGAPDGPGAAITGSVNNMAHKNRIRANYRTVGLITMQNRAPVSHCTSP